MRILAKGFQSGISLPFPISKKHAGTASNKYRFPPDSIMISWKAFTALVCFSFLASAAENKRPDELCSNYHKIPCGCNKKRDRA